MIKFKKINKANITNFYNNNNKLNSKNKAMNKNFFKQINKT